MSITNEALYEAANKIEDETLRGNAVAFLDKMTEVIEGIGDRPITWSPSGLKLVQSMTDTDKLPNGAKPGDLIVGDKIIEGDLIAIPLSSWDARIMWHPDTDRNEIICRSPDAKQGSQFGSCYTCAHSQFVEGEGSACNKTKNFLAISSDLSDVFIVSFSKSQYTMGMDWEKLMRRMKVLPFKRSYNVGSGAHPKYKKVKALDITVTTDSPTPDVNAFLEVLFRRTREDRVASLEGFYEYIRNRANSDQAALENQDSGTRAIGVEDANPSVEDGEDEAGQTYTV